MSGLVRTSLIENMSWGNENDLKKRGFPNAPGDGLYFSPTSFGAELALWVNKYNFLPNKYFLSRKIKLDEIPGIQIPQNALPVSEL